MSSSSRHEPAPTSGRDFAAERLALGVSASAVARALGVHQVRLEALEARVDPLDGALRERWTAALGSCAQARVRALARHGWRLDELPDRGLRSAMRGYVLTK